MGPRGPIGVPGNKGDAGWPGLIGKLTRQKARSGREAVEEKGDVMFNNL